MYLITLNLPIAGLFNDCFSTAKSPSQWKVATVNLIFKRATVKSNWITDLYHFSQTELQAYITYLKLNYRPISLLSSWITDQYHFSQTELQAYITYLKLNYRPISLLSSWITDQYHFSQTELQTYITSLKLNYKPISLLSSWITDQYHFSQIFPKFRNALFTTAWETIYLQITEKNSGFKPLDSAVNELVDLIHDIYSGLDNRIHILWSILDISKAFDQVWHPGLLHKLR